MNRIQGSRRDVAGTQVNENILVLDASTCDRGNSCETRMHHVGEEVLSPSTNKTTPATTLADANVSSVWEDSPESHAQQSGTILAAK